MTVRYHTRQERSCRIRVPARRHRACHHGVPSRSGSGHRQGRRRLLVETVTPLALEVALAVQQELQTRLEEVDRLRRKQVERARYEAELARRRYLHVDPDNRLVADSLEADWNEKLRALTEAQEQYEQQRQAGPRAERRTARPILPGQRLSYGSGEIRRPRTGSGNEWSAYCSQT